MASAANVGTTSLLLLRATYFEWQDQRPVEDYPAALPLPTLEDTERALAQLRLYLVLAHRIPSGDEGAVYILTGQQQAEAQESGFEPQLIGLHMGSPLTVLLHMPPQYLVGSALGLLLLAERICTFGPRVTAKRKKWLLEAATADAGLRQIREAQADVLSSVLLGEGPDRLAPRGPDRLDFIDTDEGEDSLEVVQS